MKKRKRFGYGCFWCCLLYCSHSLTLACCCGGGVAERGEEKKGKRKEGKKEGMDDTDGDLILILILIDMTDGRSDAVFYQKGAVNYDQFNLKLSNVPLF